MATEDLVFNHSRERQGAQKLASFSPSLGGKSLQALIIEIVTPSHSNRIHASPEEEEIIHQFYLAANEVNQTLNVFVSSADVVTQK